MNEATKQTIISSLIVAVIGLLALLIFYGIVGKQLFKPTEEKPPIEVKLPEPKPSEYPDYNAIKGTDPDPKLKSIKVAMNHVNDKPATVDFDGVAKDYTVSGKFSRIYLYIEAFVDYKRPLTVWDDFYFKINNTGGHLINVNNALPVPPSDFSVFLYNLRSISYYPTIKDKERNINKKINQNFFDLLKDRAKIMIIASISSDRPGRIMKEISIYYECFEGSECSIEEIK